MAKKRSRRTYILPEGGVTTSPEKFGKAWVDFFKPVQQVLGIHAYGFDYDGSSSWQATADSRVYKAVKRGIGNGSPFNLPGWLVRRLRNLCLERLSEHPKSDHLQLSQHPRDPEQEADRIIQQEKDIQKMKRDMNSSASHRRVSPVVSKVGKRLFRLRLARGWTQDEVAIRAGVGKSTISCLESGYNSAPSAKLALALARAFRVDVTKFLGE